MTKKEILDAIHGKMIISCQAVEGEPLYVEEKSIMYLMARAAKQAGTPAIRTSSIRDVIAIKEETGLPVIGLVKIQYPILLLPLLGLKASVFGPCFITGY